MTVRVALRDIIDGMQWHSDEMTAYLNLKSGQVVPVSDEELAAAEAGEASDASGDWEAEAREIARGVLAGEDYIALPDRFDIDEYRMMERFANAVTDAEASARLRHALQGRGAFRYFKDSVHELGLAQQWYAYRDRQFEEVAIAWCEANGIEYTRDQPPRSS
jgi:hypothetical protein